MRPDGRGRTGILPEPSAERGISPPVDLNGVVSRDRHGGLRALGAETAQRAEALVLPRRWDPGVRNEGGTAGNPPLTGTGVFVFERPADGGGFIGDFAVTLASIREAQRVLEPVVHRTPMEHSKTFSAMSGASVHLKLENQQKTGSFKVRGAYHCIANLHPARRAAGVIASSAGNHAQGVAFAAQVFGVPATVVMPETAPLSKQRATAGYGAKVVLSGRTYDEAYAQALRMQGEEGLTFVHPFDDLHVIAGQGTIGVEVVEALEDLDAVVVPVGGGGLAAGIAVAVKSLSPRTRVIGVQAAAAPAMALSWRVGRRLVQAAGHTLADGLAVSVPGEITFTYLQHYLDDLVTVEEEAIAEAIALLLERAKMLVEGAGAVGLAAVLSQGLATPGSRVAVLVTGGNIDVGRILPDAVREMLPQAPHSGAKRR